MTDRRRLLVTGATGMVGRAVVAAAFEHGYEVATVARHAMPGSSTADFQWDVAGEPAPPALVDWSAEAIIHAASFTDVDGAERDPELARRVNVHGTTAVAKLAADTSARLVYLSTDGVFDGARGWYTETDVPNPVNVYAETKCDGEREALRVENSVVARFNVVGPARLAWWILRSAAEAVPISVFIDVRFNPLEVRDLAEALLALSEGDVTGVCHLASDEAMSKAEFAERLIAAAGLTERAVLSPARSADQPAAARRPLDTTLWPSERTKITPSSLATGIERLAHEFVAARG